jgi:hypothetical protein
VSPCCGAGNTGTLYIIVENKTKLSDVITVASQLKIEPFAKTFLILRGEGLRGL